MDNLKLYFERKRLTPLIIFIISSGIVLIAMLLFLSPNQVPVLLGRNYSIQYVIYPSTMIIPFLSLPLNMGFVTLTLYYWFSQEVDPQTFRKLKVICFIWLLYSCFVFIQLLPLSTNFRLLPFLSNMPPDDMFVNTNNLWISPPNTSYPSFLFELYPPLHTLVIIFIALGVWGRIMFKGEFLQEPFYMNLSVRMAQTYYVMNLITILYLLHYILITSMRYLGGGS